MSKLEELIQKLCPNGVEYKRFDEACTLNARIGWQRLTKAEYKSSGEYVLITGTDFTSSYEVNYSSCVYVSEERYLQDKKIQIKNGDVLITKDGTLGKVAQVSDLSMPATLNGGVFVVRPKDELLLPRYIMYFLLSGHFQKVVDQQKTGSTISHLTQALFSRLQLPVPPLEVQREIVRVLDSFTLLTAELTAELTARKKQYEFYRNKMLTFDSQEGKASEITWRTLAEIADISTGSSNTDDAIEDGVYPFYVRSQEPLKKNDYEYDEEAIITAGDGVGVGKVFHYVNGKYALHQRAYRIHPVSTKLSGRYLYHYFITKFPSYIGKQMYQGSVPSIRRPMLNSFEIAIPALEIQKKIVAVLDNFDTICTDLNIGLPAEIEARQKQYEYYRDLLLTFAEKGNTVLTDDGRRTGAVELGAIKLIQYVFGYAKVNFGTIATIVRGASPRPIKNFITEEDDGVNWIKIGDIKPNTKYVTKTEERITKEGVIKSRIVHSGDFILSNSMSFGRPYILKIDGCIHDGWLSISNFNDIVTSDYLYHLLNSESVQREMKQRASFGGAVQNLNADIVKLLKLNIPSIDKQNRIVSILDRFDTLCNDISAGLPAEIEARQKQYEYYRDKLLSFKKIQK